MKAILGRKIGMSQVFSKSGESIPVSIIEVKPNIVTNVLSIAKNGYEGLQLSVFDKRDKLETKPVLGHLKKAKTGAKRFTKEIRNMKGFSLGEKVLPNIFSEGDFVDVIGISKGKGFAGAIKRHNQSIGPKSHGGGGGSKPVRLTGSLGDISGNKVVKGMTMPGHLGHKRSTTQNLEIIKINENDNFILVKGSIPGPKKSFVIVRENVKKKSSKAKEELFTYESKKEFKSINKKILENNEKEQTNDKST